MQHKRHGHCPKCAEYTDQVRAVFGFWICLNCKTWIGR
jgi:ribosomal protein L37AE/L43A